LDLIFIYFLTKHLLNSLQKLIYILPFFAFACVKPRIYKEELAARQQSEARETVLNSELSDRKKESILLIEQIAAANKMIGKQESEILYLQSEVNAKSAQFGESSSKLQIEKDRLGRELHQTQVDLKEKETELNRIFAIDARKKEYLTAQYLALNEGYTNWFESGVNLTVLDKKLELSLPDVQLFDANGLTITSNGYSMLLPLAQFLTNRPDVDIQIVCYTDNTLPKEKSIKDSWDWSLARATNIARMLLREFSVNANQMTPIGKGEYYPVSSNETPQGRSENRRTVIQIVVD
jgi:chemotaxis protein MotB